MVPRAEVKDACDVLLKLLQRQVPDAQKTALARHLTERLEARVARFWFPAEPTRGSGHRCVLISCGNVDPIVVSAAIAAGVAKSGEEVGDLLPRELALFVDPGDVAVRIGVGAQAWPVSRFLHDETENEMTTSGRNMPSRHTPPQQQFGTPPTSNRRRTNSGPTMASSYHMAASFGSSMSVMAPSFWPGVNMGYHNPTPSSHSIMAHC